MSDRRMKSSVSNDNSESDTESSDTEEERRRSKGKRKNKDKEHSRSSKHDSKRKDKKKKKKKKHRHRGSSSDDSDSCSSEDEEERRKKRKLLKEAKKILKKHKKEKDRGNTDDMKGKLDRQVLSEEDYYLKNKEFSTWLKEKRGLYFTSLSSDDTRRYFKDFVEAWNAGKLSQNLYDGIDNAARTDHKWNIKDSAQIAADKEEEFEYKKKLEKIQRKKHRKEHEDLMDELLPKATGRDRLIEKRAIRREEGRRREESPEAFREQDIMGGSDDIKKRIERERAWREKKAAEKSGALKEKQSTFQQKENATMDQLRALVNVAGGKITIPKRTD